MDLQELIEEAPAVVSIVAAIGMCLLLPLFLSQRRDIQRLRSWMEREPNHPVTDIAASEALLDRAEAELEELLGPREPAAEAATEVRPAPGETAPISAATRVTHERPALERITMERAALVPHPRWRRFTARATQPRVLIVVGLVALALGIAGIFVTQELLSDGDGGTGAGGGIDRADVAVTVLNGTAVPGLAQTVATEVPRQALLDFFVRESDPAARVSIVDSGEDVVRVLDESVALEAGEDARVTYNWDGRDDDGEFVRDGRYRLRVDLPDHDREMIWPKRLVFSSDPADASQRGYNACEA